MRRIKSKKTHRDTFMCMIVAGIRLEQDALYKRKLMRRQKRNLFNAETMKIFPLTLKLDQRLKRPAFC